MFQLERKYPLGRAIDDPKKVFRYLVRESGIDAKVPTLKNSVIPPGRYTKFSFSLSNIYCESR